MALRKVAGLLLGVSRLRFRVGGAGRGFVGRGIDGAGGLGFAGILGAHAAEQLVIDRMHLDRRPGRRLPGGTLDPVSVILGDLCHALGRDAELLGERRLRGHRGIRIEIQGTLAKRALRLVPQLAEIVERGMHLVRQLDLLAADFARQRVAAGQRLSRNRRLLLELSRRDGGTGQPVHAEIAGRHLHLGAVIAPHQRLGAAALERLDSRAGKAAGSGVVDQDSLTGLRHHRRALGQRHSVGARRRRVGLRGRGPPGAGRGYSRQRDLQCFSPELAGLGVGDLRAHHGLAIGRVALHARRELLAAGHVDHDVRPDSGAAGRRGRRALPGLAGGMIDRGGERPARRRRIAEAGGGAALLRRHRDPRCRLRRGRSRGCSRRCDFAWCRGLRGVRPRARCTTGAAEPGAHEPADDGAAGCRVRDVLHQAPVRVGTLHRIVLRDLLGCGLRQFLEQALGDGAAGAAGQDAAAETALDALGDDARQHPVALPAEQTCGDTRDQHAARREIVGQRGTRLGWRPAGLKQAPIGLRLGQRLLRELGDLLADLGGGLAT